MTTTYSRVTVIGRQRQMDTVLPIDEPLGRLLPDLLRMLGEPLGPTPQRRFLTTASGQLVGPENSLSTARVADGAVLRLAAEGELPPPPTVYDVTEQVVEDLGRRATVFGPRHRRMVAGAGLVFAVLAAASALMAAAPEDIAVFLLVLVGSIAGLGGVALGRYRRPLGAVPLLLIATGTVSGALGLWAASAGWSLPLVVGAGAVGVSLGPLLFGAAGLSRGGFIGGLAALVLVLLWLGGSTLDIATDRIAVVLAVVCVLLLGVLPRLALMMSGLTVLDDRRAAGDEVRRTDVKGALNAAHLGLALATVPIAMSSVVAGWVLVREWSAWSVSVAVLLAFLLASRSRPYPLVVEVAMLIAASLGVLLALTVVLSVRSSGGALIAVGILLVVGVVSGFGLAYSPEDHVRARLSQLLDVVEIAAMIALVPLALGVFGVYTDLLNAV